MPTESRFSEVMTGPVRTLLSSAGLPGRRSRHDLLPAQDPFKTKINLYKYFSGYPWQIKRVPGTKTPPFPCAPAQGVSCFEGFGDDARGFYAVYSELFEAPRGSLNEASADMAGFAPSHIELHGDIVDSRAKSEGWTQDSTSDSILGPYRVRLWN